MIAYLANDVVEANSLEDDSVHLITVLDKIRIIIKPIIRELGERDADIRLRFSNIVFARDETNRIDKHKRVKHGFEPLISIDVALGIIILFEIRADLPIEEGVELISSAEIQNDSPFLSMPLIGGIVGVALVRMIVLCRLMSCVVRIALICVMVHLRLRVRVA